VRKKPRNVPVFLIYAGVIHAIGLALLLPMLITLPGPGREVATEPAAIDVDIVPGSPLAGVIDSEGEQTSAIPSALETRDEEAGVNPAHDAKTAQPLGPEADLNQEEKNAVPQVAPEKAASEDPETANGETAKSSKPIVAKPAKKTVAMRRTAKSSVRRAAKTDKKIAPFNGALTGLFSPGAPAKRR
jgi:hypothetical protein